MKPQNNVPARKLIDRLTLDSHWGALQAFVATTYELTTDFFEVDFLPTLFGLGAWDDRSWSSRIALERKLAGLDGRACVLQEARCYRGRPRSLRLKTDRVVLSSGAVMHAKVSLLVAERAVRVVVGSANLTERGFRRNREAVAVLTVTESKQEDAQLVQQCLDGFEKQFATAISPDALAVITAARVKLSELAPGSKKSDSRFVWSGGGVRLWREFVDQWSVNEPIKQIRIVSPFWSDDASGTLETFINELRKHGSLTGQAEVALLTAAAPLKPGYFVPVLPARFRTHNWGASNCHVTAQAVDPTVLPEEVEGMQEFAGLRD